MNRGTLCPKGAALLDFVNSASRLKYPEYRAPGASEWKRISWDDAFTRIARHMKDLMGLDFIEIRLLDRASGRLVPLLTVGMTPMAANRELFARKEGNGVTGFVADTGQSYLCADS